jgi:hypothetical protein
MTCLLSEKIFREIRHKPNWFLAHAHLSNCSWCHGKEERLRFPCAMSIARYILFVMFWTFVLIGCCVVRYVFDPDFLFSFALFFSRDFLYISIKKSDDHCWAETALLIYPTQLGICWFSSELMLWLIVFLNCWTPQVKPTESIRIPKENVWIGSSRTL